MTSPKLETLRALVAKSPENALARFGLANDPRDAGGTSWVAGMRAVRCKPLVHLSPMRIRRWLGPISTVALLSACSNAATPSAAPLDPLSALPRQLSIAEQRVIAGSNQFAFSLFREIAGSAPAGSNVFISPFSVSMALGMTMNGAEGGTFDAMRGTLGFREMSRDEINASYRSLIDLLRGLDKGVELRIGNSIWYRQNLEVLPEFVASSTASFDATVRALDFSSPSAVTTINDWVKASTAGKISTIVDAIPEDMVMYLINAIYFKGSWRDAFDPADTSPGTFATSSGAISVPMMHQTSQLAYSETDELQAVELPYGRSAYAMTVVLPKPGRTATTLVADIDGERWSAIAGSSSRAEVELFLPKFKLEWEDMLNRPLIALGMGVAFTDRADFSRIRSAGDLMISEVRHKTYVDVNEEGTEAAAVTSVGVVVTSAPARVVMRVDRPFVVVLREKLSGTILFVGKIENPTG
jgi:serpin B